jgi:hypothetical protein
MPIVVKTKNSTTNTSVPAAASLAQGELAVNITDQKLWVGDASGDPVLLAEPGGGAVTEDDAIMFALLLGGG